MFKGSQFICDVKEKLIRTCYRSTCPRNYCLRNRHFWTYSSQFPCPDRSLETYPTNLSYWQQEHTDNTKHIFPKHFADSVVYAAKVDACTITLTQAQREKLVRFAIPTIDQADKARKRIPCKHLEHRLGEELEGTSYKEEIKALGHGAYGVVFKIKGTDKCGGPRHAALKIKFLSQSKEFFDENIHLRENLVRNEELTKCFALLRGDQSIVLSDEDLLQAFLKNHEAKERFGSKYPLCHLNVMPYVDGKTLLDWQSSSEYEEPNALFHVDKGLLQILQRKIENNLIHRDFHAGNIMVRSSGDVPELIVVDTDDLMRYDQVTDEMIPDLVVNQFSYPGGADALVKKPIQSQMNAFAYLLDWLVYGEYRKQPKIAYTLALSQELMQLAIEWEDLSNQDMKELALAWLEQKITELDQKIQN